MNAIFGIFGDHKSATQAAEALKKAGFGAKQITFLTRSDKDAIAALKQSVHEGDVDFYLDCVEKDGDTLIIVDSEKEKVSQAAEILSKHGMIDVDKRAEIYAKAHGKKPALRGYKDSDQVFHVVQEALEVGKREVERGKVRVYNRITSKEVEHQVGLRDETIQVQRRVVDRPVDAASFDDHFKERSFEVREVDELPVVSIVARVLEEVVVSKDVGEKIHTIKDTLRRSDVEVEEHRAHRAFADFDKELHDYYARSLAKTGHKYDEYIPAFKFGHSLATSDQTHKLAWADLETEAQKTWEKNNPGTWAAYSAAIHHAFDRAHD